MTTDDLIPLINQRLKEIKCEHNNYEVYGTCSDGCCDKCKCTDCGKVWMEEMPD